ncbi:MAG: pyruvate, water dikinase regulatory protein [Maricaulaceae bacterium]
MRQSRPPCSVYVNVHLVSDSTGETLASVMKASIAQFDNVIPIEHLYALVRSTRQLDRVLSEIEAAPGMVLYTIMNDELRESLERRCGELGMPHVSVLDPILAAFSRYLGAAASQKAGAQRVLDDQYYRRIEALNFAMTHDDGQGVRDLYDADVILVGVSRTSKTPTSVYLANRGVKAANIPIVPTSPLPEEIFELKKPLIIGLTTSPDRLVQIRRNRLLSLAEDRDTSYVETESVKDEVAYARRLFSKHQWPVIDVTRRSIEETATKILLLITEKRPGFSIT